MRALDRSEKTVFIRIATAFIITVAIIMSGMYWGYGVVNADSSEYEKNQYNTKIGIGKITNPVIPSENHSWRGSYVYYGKYDKDQTGTATPVKYCVLDKESYQFGANGASILLHSNAILFNHSFGNANTSSWADSTLKSWLNTDAEGFLKKEGNFTSAEEDSMANSTKSRADNNDGTIEGTNYSFASLNGEKIFVLDSKEVSRESYGYSNKATKNYTWNVGDWWLRTMYSTAPTPLAVVATYDNTPCAAVTAEKGVCPAFNVKKSSILFTTCIRDSIRLNGSEYGGEYKFTLKDNEMVTSIGEITKNGRTLSIPYTITGANKNNATRITALAVHEGFNYGLGDQIVYYAPLTIEGTVGTSGVGKLNLDGIVNADWDSNHHLYIFAEHVNTAEHKEETDYASEPVEIKIPVTGISLDHSSETLSLGEKLQLTATVTPLNALLDEVLWTSSDSGVASVDFDGLVTANWPGEAVITATTVDGEKTAKCKITVTDASNPSNPSDPSNPITPTDPSIPHEPDQPPAVNTTPQMELNNNKLVVQIGKTSKTIKADLSYDSIESVTVNKSIADVKFSGDTIIVKAGKKAGKAKVTVTSASGIVRTFSLEVQKAKVTTKTLTIKPGTKKYTLTGVGQTKVINVKATPDYYSTKEKITAKSNKSKVADAKADYLTGVVTITAKGKGAANITISAGKKKQVIKVTVKAKKQ